MLIIASIYLLNTLLMWLAHIAPLLSLVSHRLRWADSRRLGRGYERVLWQRFVIRSLWALWQKSSVRHGCDCVCFSSDGGDMDSRDYVGMRSERRLRDGLEGLPGRQQKIGSFERFTKVRTFLKGSRTAFVFYFCSVLTQSAL